MSPDPTPDDDQAWRTRFAALRAADATRTPPFRSFLRPAQSQRPPAWVPALAATLAAAGAAATWVAVSRPGHTPPSAASRPAAARMEGAGALDFLLVPPGGSLLAGGPGLERSAVPGPRGSRGP